MGILRTLHEAYQLTLCYRPLCLDKTDYDQYWKDKRKDSMGKITDFQRKRADWILPRITESSTVLDIGCGDGGVLLYLARHKSFKPIAADCSRYALNFLETQGVQTIFFNLADFDTIDSLPIVDHVVLFEVLEHLQNPEFFLRCIEPKIKRSIFFSIPNSGYFPYRLRLLLGKSIMQWRLHPGEHLRFWTARDLHWWLQELGFDKRSELFGYEGVPLLNRISPSLFAMGFVGEIHCNK